MVYVVNRVYLAADTVYVVDNICVVVYTLHDAAVMMSEVLAAVLQVRMQLCEEHKEDVCLAAWVHRRCLRWTQNSSDHLCSDLLPLERPLLDIVQWQWSVIDEDVSDSHC